MKKLSISILLAFVLVACIQKSTPLGSISTQDSTIVAENVDSVNDSSKSTDNSLGTDSLGIWSVSHYVDEFGEESKAAFIFGSTEGTFSNSATQDSRLNVHFLIDSESKISIQLYEYASNNPVKAGVEQNYKIKIKSADNQTAVLYANNYSDRLTLNKKDAKKLSAFLKKGGKVSFYILEISEYSSSNYKFDLYDCSGFDKALKALKKK